MLWLYSKAIDGATSQTGSEITITHTSDNTEGDYVTHVFEVNTSDFTYAIKGLTEGSYTVPVEGNIISVKNNIPLNLYNTLTVEGKGTVLNTSHNLTFFAPENENYQYMVTPSNDNYYSTNKVSVPAMGKKYSEYSEDESGKLKITKKDSADNTELNGASFNVYSDAECTTLITSMVTGYDVLKGQFDVSSSGYDIDIAFHEVKLESKVIKDGNSIEYSAIERLEKVDEKKDTSETPSTPKCIVNFYKLDEDGTRYTCIR